MPNRTVCQDSWQTWREPIAEVNDKERQLCIGDWYSRRGRLVFFFQKIKSNRPLKILDRRLASALPPKFAAILDLGVNVLAYLSPMFMLAEMKDTVRIPPHMFHIDFNEAIVETLNKKFANKVVHQVGLCIALWDITKLEKSFIFPGDGASHTIVHFRYVVFRPFMDEIVIGKIKSCSKESVQVSLGFFDEIIIPSDSMQHPSKFVDKEQLWAWEYEAEEEKHDLFMDIGEEIRFRVMDETFVDTTPVGDGSAATTEENKEPEVKKSPYTIVGSISEPGLGLLSWWNG